MIHPFYIVFRSKIQLSISGRYNVSGRQKLSGRYHIRSMININSGRLVIYRIPDLPPQKNFPPPFFPILQQRLDLSRHVIHSTLSTGSHHLPDPDSTTSHHLHSRHVTFLKYRKDPPINRHPSASYLRYFLFNRLHQPDHNTSTGSQFVNRISSTG